MNDILVYIGLVCVVVAALAIFAQGWALKRLGMCGARDSDFDVRVYLATARYAPGAAIVAFCVGLALFAARCWT